MQWAKKNVRIAAEVDGLHPCNDARIVLGQSDLVQRKMRWLIVKNATQLVRYKSVQHALRVEELAECNVMLRV